MYSGEIQLLKKLDIDFIEENVSNYGTSANVKEFRRKERLFMIIDGKGQEVKLNKKSIMPLLEKEGNNLEGYMKQNKNKLKSEEDLIDLIKYCEAS
ncbi:MAG: hypothetical protein HC859_14785 [Bacteroidia bacterium]|nr:hypothetical protein [Bacteroidia bacterium]